MSLSASLRDDYLCGAAALQPFYAHPVQHPDFERIISKKSRSPVDRETLAEVLEAQNRDLPDAALVLEGIRSLRSERCFTVTTGHQLTLFGGPLFTTYKILSTIRLAEQLAERYPDCQFVPVLWIHTEDHDAAEINHYYDAEGLKYTYAGRFSGAVGRHVLEGSIRQVYPANFSEALRSTHQPGMRLSEAFRRLMHALFGRYGLVILDADEPRLKARLQPVVEAEFRGRASFHAVQDTSARLEAAGYPLQITPREINLFYLDGESRSRIVPDGTGYHVLERQMHLSEAEWLELSRTHPERFSPNVCLRPLYQEMILPNLAYFGGWGELSYWMQLKGVFDRFDVPFPLVLPRFSATLFPGDALSRWESLGFEARDIAKPLPALYQQYLPKVWSEAPLRGEAEQVLARIRSLHGYVDQALSPTLARSVAAMEAKAGRWLDNLEQKARRAARQRHPEPFRQIAALKQQIQPDGTVQERSWSLAAVTWQPPEAFVDEVYRLCSPLDYQHRYLALG
ncbi:MAG: bacillithiol biosynthesis cysteine-adding enzyme BshC [Bacteroidia bacterium]|nr:bacillithiol biosynthesis cysteine-adding enzyme BshC [Bacteroidia bacterium]